MDILLIAIPLALQTYFIFFLSWKGGRWLGLNYRTCAPASMIGASNFFELSVAVAIALFGLNSGAAWSPWWECSSKCPSCFIS